MSRRLLFAVVTVSLIGMSLSGCGDVPIASQSTSTPAPTYTPVPTYTPAPTYTPVPTYTPMGASTSAVTTTVAAIVTSSPVAQYTPWPTQATWPTPTPVPGMPPEVEYYVQEVVPYMEYMTYGLQAMEQAMYAYSDGYITVEDVNATLEIYNEIVLTVYESALAAVAPETIALIAGQIVDELDDVHAIWEMIDSLPLEQWSSEELGQALQAMSQVRDRTQLVDTTFAGAMSQFGSGDHLGPENLQLQLPGRGELSLPKPGQGRPGFDGSQSPGRPQIEQSSRPQPQIPEINPPSRPSRR